MVNVTIRCPECGRPVRLANAVPANQAALPFADQPARLTVSSLLDRYGMTCEELARILWLPADFIEKLANDGAEIDGGLAAFAERRIREVRRG